jgi:hypothetical protein
VPQLQPSPQKEYVDLQRVMTIRQKRFPAKTSGYGGPERGRENVMFFADSAGVSLTNWFKNQGQLYVLRAKLTS